jgi:ElaB/YqjD/DUF883 family membrane-anchored ribosome-binding protein
MLPKVLFRNGAPMTPPPPHKEAMELARKILLMLGCVQIGPEFAGIATPIPYPDDVQRLAALLEQRDAQVWAEAIERAAQIIDDCNREGPYQAIGAAPRIRALQKDPHWLERERMKARIEGMEQAIVIADEYVSEKDWDFRKKHGTDEINDALRLRRAELEKLLAAPEGGDAHVR